jgi:hypothetical protein
MTHATSSTFRETNRATHAFKSPRRITITLPFKTYEDLIRRSDEDGRSLSNLAAFLLETALSTQKENGEQFRLQPKLPGKL